MDTVERFEKYLQHLLDGLGYQDRHTGLRGYCSRSCKTPKTRMTT